MLIVTPQTGLLGSGKPAAWSARYEGFGTVANDWCPLGAAATALHFARAPVVHVEGKAKRTKLAKSDGEAGLFTGSKV